MTLVLDGRSKVVPVLNVLVEAVGEKGDRDH